MFYSKCWNFEWTYVSVVAIVRVLYHCLTLWLTTLDKQKIFRICHSRTGQHVHFLAFDHNHFILFRLFNYCLSCIHWIVCVQRTPLQILKKIRMIFCQFVLKWNNRTVLYFVQKYFLFWSNFSQSQMYWLVAFSQWSQTT